MKARLINWLVWGLCGLAMLLSLVAIFLFLRIAVPVNLQPLLILTGTIELLFSLVTAPMGALIAVRKSNYAVGGVLIGLALAEIIPLLAQYDVIYNYLHEPNQVPSLLLTAIAQSFVVPTFAILLLLLFPTGHFLSRGWAFVGIAAPVYNLFALGVNLLDRRWFVSAAGIPLIVANPFGIWRNDSPFLIILPMFGLMIAAVAGALVRYRHARGDERQQLKWFAYIAALFIITLALYDLNPIFLIVVDLVALGLPVAIAVAIYKYRLYDIDLLIRRTVTYGIVTALLVGLFALLVVLLQQFFASVTGTRQNELVTVLSTLAIASLFVPLRQLVQPRIDKRFNRSRYNAQQVLADFANTVRDETDLEKLTGRLMQVVDETMQPRTLSIWLRAEKREGKW